MEAASPVAPPVWRHRGGEKIQRIANGCSAGMTSLELSKVTAFDPRQGSSREVLCRYFVSDSVIFRYLFNSPSCFDAYEVLLHYASHMSLHVVRAHRLC